MGQYSNIQWCDSTVNPTTGCEGCELWKWNESLGRATGSCWSGPLHENRLAKSLPHFYAPTFTEVRLAPGRMAKAAAMSDLTGKPRLGKPWLDGLPRVIFPADMSDLFSKAVPFEYIRDEFIANVASPKGSRHIWMALTKRPLRAREFAEWLLEQGIPWPKNLWMGTSVTSERTAKRAQVLAYHPAPTKFISFEPMWGPVEFPAWVLRNVALVIFGGESRTPDHEPAPCDIGWIRQGVDRCRREGVCAFVKQLGSHVAWSPSLGPPGGWPDHVRVDYQRGGEASVHRIRLRDSHGGDWDEWSADLRVREFPRVASQAAEGVGR